MTATDELRHLLDERGVKWMPIAWNPKRETFYHAANGVGFCADEYTGGVKIYTDATITPAQAVEATQGRGTCEMRLRDDIHGHAYQDIYECSECGEQVIQETCMGESKPPRYCPWCGREVVE